MRDDDHDPLAPPEWVNTGRPPHAVDDPGDDPPPEWWDHADYAAAVTAALFLLAGCAAWAGDVLALGAACVGLALSALHTLHTWRKEHPHA